MRPPAALIRAWDRVVSPDEALVSSGKISVTTIPGEGKVVFVLPEPMRRGKISPDAARYFAALLIRAADEVSPKVFVGPGMKGRVA